jgi:hypothetical protein
MRSFFQVYKIGLLSVRLHVYFWIYLTDLKNVHQEFYVKVIVEFIFSIKIVLKQAQTWK